MACSNEGQLLCKDCMLILPRSEPSCYRCREPSVNNLTCPQCLQESRIVQVQAAASYKSAAKQLVWSLKLSGAKNAASIMAKCMVNILDITPKTIIIPVPTATSRARQRGYDQARLLARNISKLTDLAYRDYLARSGQRHQHGLTRSVRLTQLNNSYRLKRNADVNGASVILIDDVVTTGATLEAAAMVLYSAGARTISAAVFARPDAHSEHIID